MRQRKSWLLSVLIAASGGTFAQDASSFMPPQDSVLTYADSLSIFQLIDSLLMLEEPEAHSQLAVRLAYNSNVLSTGRTLGIDQFGLSPGMSYYHKTGLFADVSFYWSNDFEPKYYLTIASAGYMHSFSNRFSLIAGYDHYFYRFEEDFTPYSNAITISPFLDFKHVSFRVDYSYYFGEEQANRLMPSLSGMFEKRNWLGLDRVALSPGISVLFGDATLTEILFPSTREEWLQAILRSRQGLPWYTLKAERVFGVMNYSIMLPLSVTRKVWTFNLSYTFNIPKALPGETLTLENSGFLSASLTYFINLGRKKTSL
jgi:hypothetical protein